MYRWLLNALAFWATGNHKVTSSCLSCCEENVPSVIDDRLSAVEYRVLTGKLIASACIYTINELRNWSATMMLESGSAKVTLWKRQVWTWLIEKGVRMSNDTLATTSARSIFVWPLRVYECVPNWIILRLFGHQRFWDSLKLFWGNYLIEWRQFRDSGKKSLNPGSAT